MKRLAITFYVLTLGACAHMFAPKIDDCGVLIATVEEGKFLLESGRTAYVDLGQNKGWLKIALVKKDWDRGSVTVFFSKTAKFSGSQKPYRIYTDELDPCLVDLKEFDVALALTGGTPSASYVEFFWGVESRIFRPKTEELSQSPATSGTHL